MCTLALYYRTFPEHPLLIAANRDEYLSRPSTPPVVLDERFSIFGGRDDRCGGTWFGVNGRGIAAALLNRMTGSPPDRSLRSRGLLCLEALRHPSAEQAIEGVRGEDPLAYNPFNLLVADPDHAFVATNHGSRMAISELPPGLHLLTNLDLNDPTCPRIAASYRLFARVLEDGHVDPEDSRLVERLREILSRHDTTLDPRSDVRGNSLCVHAGEYGTCSSTLVFRSRSGRWTYLHSDAPPCRGRYARQAIPSVLQTADA